MLSDNKLTISKLFLFLITNIGFYFYNKSIHKPGKTKKYYYYIIILKINETNNLHYHHRNQDQYFEFIIIYV